jgi:hypothetical protein
VALVHLIQPDLFGRIESEHAFRSSTVAAADGRGNVVPERFRSAYARAARRARGCLPRQRRRREDDHTRRPPSVLMTVPVVIRAATGSAR